MAIIHTSYFDSTYTKQGFKAVLCKIEGEKPYIFSINDSWGVSVQTWHYDTFVEAMLHYFKHCENNNLRTV